SARGGSVAGCGIHRGAGGSLVGFGQGVRGRAAARGADDANHSGHAANRCPEVAEFSALFLDYSLGRGKSSCHAESSAVANRLRSSRKTFSRFWTCLRAIET